MPTFALPFRRGSSLEGAPRDSRKKSEKRFGGKGKEIYLCAPDGETEEEGKRRCPVGSGDESRKEKFFENIGSLEDGR